MPVIPNLLEQDTYNLEDQLSDCETTPLNSNASRRNVTETKGWDVFRILPPEVDSGSMASQRCVEITIKVLKFITYIITFIVVLAAGVASKGMVLLMTSQLKPNRRVPYCNHFLARNKEWSASIPFSERSAWIWCLFFAYVVPEIGTWIRATRICIFKSAKVPQAAEMMTVFAFETLHTLGIALAVFVVFPELDVVRAVMLTNCFSFVPGLLGMLSRKPKEDKRMIRIFLDVVALLAQSTGFFMWSYQRGTSNYRMWLVPVCVAFTSCGWWENYVDRESPTGFVRKLGEIKEKLKSTRYSVYFYVSLWKMASFFGLMLVFLRLINGDDVVRLFTEFGQAFSSHRINVTERTEGRHFLSTPPPPDLPSQFVTPFPEIIPIRSWGSAPIYVLFVQILSSWLCYVVGKFACKICIQGFSFAFPVNLVVPVTASVLMAACGLRSENECLFQNVLPDYLYWDCLPGNSFADFLSNQHGWIWVLWLLSQAWFTFHIWTPKCERLASTEKLFATPMYSSFFVDQSLSMNRRKDEELELKSEEIASEKESPYENEFSQYYETISVTESCAGSVGKTIKSVDNIPKIFACATMWHETSEEMVDMLKSIFRMDEDQSARRIALKYFNSGETNYYEFETHIFVDDAFEMSDENENENSVNPFVKLLVKVIDVAGSHVHQTTVRLRPPKKYPTPYGGRLVWTLPGKTKIFAHLKDKSKIRHRKRWSQVMYMYYLLGHRLMELPISTERKEVIARNTYLLTLDGDIDFQPQAVELLVDLMKKNDKLGAACGRIHPVGSGPMVWYQKFEYAIGHWLQKATEHMIGCVLCSPGCFSLFRGLAFMDDNVMRKYTTKSEEARHYVQYDQGEDRWLCTLLLQRGYRVEYCAASDAYTHCPEGFCEFYNQRRRWVPSTMANIMDLLQDYKSTIKINDNISLPYIIYQSMLMIGTILGPGTIFLMLLGAFVAAFRIDNWTSFYANIIPILFFIVVCFCAKPDIQLLIAQILSTAYALVMMAVIVGTTLQLGEDGVGSPSAIFLIALSGSFFIAALLHPQEFWCVVPGILYLLAIPSMYLLLIIYSLVNLNIVTWGTREVQTKKTKKEFEQEKKEAEEAKAKKKLFGVFSGVEEEGSIEFSFAGLFRCMFCTHRKDKADSQQLLRIAEMVESISTRMNHVEKWAMESHPHIRRKTPRGSVKGDGMSSIAEGFADLDDSEGRRSSESESDATDSRRTRDDLINPFWIEDKDLRGGPVDYLPSTEIQFWKDLIEKYLYPIDANKEQQAKIETNLKELRNKSVFVFLMFNALFILIVFLLQLNKENLHVEWPLGVKVNVTYIEATNEVLVHKEYLHLEPIGLIFVFFFALILFIQFTAMLFHRFGTLSHILASTDISCFSKKIDAMAQHAMIDRNAIDLARNFQKLRGLDSDSDNMPVGQIEERKLIQHLEKQKQKKRPIGTLDVAFKKRFFSERGFQTIQETPILGNFRKSNFSQDTLTMMDTGMNLRHEKPRMETLGSRNPLSDGGRHRPPGSSDAVTKLESIFKTSSNGVRNAAYESAEDLSDSRNSFRLQAMTRERGWDR